MPRIGAQSSLGWFGVFRLGLVQTALGAIVVLTTSTLNRVMVVELALAAVVPGALVTLHHVLQLLRPRMGYGSDVGQRRTPWIVGGMVALAVGGVGATIATAAMARDVVLGMVIAVPAYALVGAGVSACGTSLLVLMAKRVPPERRAAASTIVWMMMIFGFAVTATLAGRALQPFGYERLLEVALAISSIAVVVTVLAMWGLEGPAEPEARTEETPGFEADLGRSRTNFWVALKEVWAEQDARRFTLFVFVSMLAYSAQDLILEPFAGAIFGFSPGASTQLSGTQHGGVFAGMLLVAIATSVLRGTVLASLKGWVVGGCVASGLAMMGLVVAGVRGESWPLEANVFLLGLANGVFSIAAIASMMTLAGRGRGAREGTRMGIWGAAQAIAFGGGGFLGTVLVDVVASFTGPSGLAYASVFALEAIGFFVAHYLALKTTFSSADDAPEGALATAAAQGS